MGKTAENTKKKSGSDGEIFRVIVKAGDGIKNFSDKIEKISGKAPEIIAMLAYTVGHFLMMLAHEPWFDEALAWLIAKDSTVWEILFEAPHYEGHPGLWHLVLMPFAKCGAPYEFSLSLVSFIFSGAAIALLLWKAPFKRIIRLLMPFTYFLFYQYSVVSRPYCMMMLAFALIAMFYNGRKEKPGRFILSLAFLCATSAYGVVIAGGLCIAWLIQLLLEAKKEGIAVVKGFFKKLSEHGKVWYLAGLLGYACFIIIRILPSQRAYAAIRITGVSKQTGMSLFQRILYTLFGSVADSFITNTFADLHTLREAMISMSDYYISLFFGIGIVTVICIYAKKQKELLSFIIPYVLFAVFSASVYMYPHHIGVFLLFVGMWAWMCMGKKKCTLPKEKLEIQNEKSNASDEVLSHKTSIEDVKKILPALASMMAVLMLLIPLYWSISSCVADINSEYSVGKREYKYLRENGLENMTMLCEWNPVFSSDDVAEGYDDFDVAFAFAQVDMAPYTDKAQLLNHLDEFGLKYALIHRTHNSEENQALIEKIKEKGVPEVLLGLPQLADFFDLTEINITDYAKVYSDYFGVIWKGIKGRSPAVIYVRRDIAEQKGLAEIKISKVS